MNILKKSELQRNEIKSYNTDMKNFLSNQYQNTFLWVPIFLAFGMAYYFSIGFEPGIIKLIIAFIIGISGIILCRKIPFVALMMLAIFGFGYAGIYAHIKNTPQISHDIHNIEISGKILDIDHTDDKIRLHIKSDEFGIVRVTTTDNIQLNAGDIISGNGGLFKPKPSDMPYGFDFARHAYFNNMTATGYIKDIKTTYTTESAVYSIRQYIKNKTNSFLTDSLLLGYKNALNSEQREIWNTNGVAHLWSISGYHMTLIAGWLFIIFYFIFRCIPKLVRRIPARIPATICSWFGLVGYVFISGGGVATLRAFIMATFIMLAIILGRNALSLRMASLTFIIIALINPYNIMRAGFQLSFAAIFGILWLWTCVGPNLPNNKILKYMYSAFLTTLIATIFTAPFILTHFGEIPIYGILGNLIFLPLFSFILMPCVIIGTICAIIGIYGPIGFAHNIYAHLYSIAESIANLPFGNLSIGIPPNVSIVLMIIGLSCLIFIRNLDTLKTLVARHINLVLCPFFICVGTAIWLTSPRPIFYISHDHKLIGAVLDGKLKFNRDHDSGNYFAFDNWRKMNREKTGTENERITKESGVYTILNSHWKIVYLPNFSSVSKNIVSMCKDSEIKYIASYFDIDSENCENKIIHGGAVIYKSGHIDYVPSNRLWHNPHE